MASMVGSPKSSRHRARHRLLIGPDPKAARNTKQGVCEGCVKAKSMRHSFSKMGTKAKGKSTKEQGLVPLVASCGYSVSGN